MPKIFLSYFLSGSIEIELSDKRLKITKEIMEEKKEFKRCDKIRNEFSEEIWEDIENGNCIEEVTEFEFE